MEWYKLKAYKIEVCNGHNIAIIPNYNMSSNQDDKKKLKGSKEDEIQAFQTHMLKT